nr:MAG TPA_asm: hypothetical protein [Caudoviricetes sp.]
MTKSTITRERVVALIAEHSYDSALVDALEHLLAAMDSEPVAYMYDGEDGTEYNGHNEFSGGGKGIPLYRHAQPALVVPENYVTAEHRRVIEMLLNVCGAAFELADDSCQQDVDGEDCHVVPDDAFQKLSDALDEIENTLPTEDIDRPSVFLAWSAMPRAALKSLLQGGNSPVIPDSSVIGWLRYDYQETFKKIGGPLFILGANDPSDAWGLRYIPVIKAADSVAVSSTEGTEE